MKLITYEWDIEILDEYDDIIDHRHHDALKDYREDDFEGKHDLVLVRDVWVDGSLTTRTWATVVDGALPEYFYDAWDRKTTKVPARFHKEWENFKKEQKKA